ncbi:S-layer homology domain-containing protein [Synechococcus sp. PCC 7336]|uniref:S-layer homology domain-containing protein n=1 Tax=Synechococcus sp. PCC 7336 TaxID=195250 RepID=UPI000345E447|nr:S-layer homology domain-containing protein [Synechococcus sp. PCC 7336]
MPAPSIRRTAALTLAATSLWLGLATVSIPSRSPLGQLPFLSPARAQPANRVAWTEPYATALEAQTSLVLRSQPLDNTLTRIELAQWLAEFFGFVANPQQRLPIADMEIDSPDYWTAQAVLQAGIMRAFEGDRFRPEGDLTKLEAIAIFVRALQLEAPSNAEVDRWLVLYSDRVAVPDIGRPFIALAGQAGLIVNHPDPAQLNPNLILTRGEGVVMLHQALAFRRQVRPLAPAVAQLAPEALPKPELTDIQVTPASGRVPPGGSLVIEARGTPQGRGTVLLAGSIELPMQEVQTGLYRATYVPTNADFIANPSIGVQLELNGEVTRRQRQFPQLALGNALDPTGPPPINSPPSLPAPVPPVTRPRTPSAAGRPTLTGIRFGPVRDLRQGDIFTINIRGDAGGVARFDIGNLAIEQPMREVQPGIYEGTYVVASNHFANSPTLRAILVKDGLGVQHRETLPFVINGASVASAPRPTPTPRPTPAPRPTPQAVNPAPTPSPDPRDAVPGLGRQPLIFAISANTGDRPLQPDDVLQVNMRGEQRGRAVFRILNVLPDVEMQEVAPGVYRGQIRIDRNTPAIRSGIVQVELERNGLSTTRSLPQTIDIDPSGS